MSKLKTLIDLKRHVRLLTRKRFCIAIAAFFSFTIILLLVFALKPQSTIPSQTIPKQSTVLSILPVEQNSNNKAIIQKIGKEEKSQYEYVYHMDESVRTNFVSTSGKKPSFKLSTSDNKQSLGFVLQAHAQEAEVTKEEVLYPVTIAGIHMKMKLKTSEREIKEEFIIEKKPGFITSLLVPRIIEFKFDIESKDLIQKVTPEGIVFESKYGAVWTVKNPIVYDAKGREGKIKGYVKDGKYIMEFESEFLKDAVYPVTVDPTVVISSSSSTNASYPSFMKHTLKTSDNTLHTFLQMGTNTSNGCGAGGLLWFYSVDSGASWICGAQISSETSNLFYASADVDQFDNIYLIYSQVTTGAGTSQDMIYRKLTKNYGPSWSVGSAQTVLDGTSTSAYNGATLAVQGTARIWLVLRSFDNTNYHTQVYYSNGFGDTPTWTQSTADLQTAGSSGTNFAQYGQVLRFGTKMGIVYVETSSADPQFAYRSDTDTDLTHWSYCSQSDDLCGVNGLSAANSFVAVGTTDGRIFLAYNEQAITPGDLYFYYYDGNWWYQTASQIDDTNGGTDSGSIGLSTDGVNVWISYPEMASASISAGLRTLDVAKPMYVKGVPPYTTTNFGAYTSFDNSHGFFDKVWTFIASTYADETTDAASTTSNDVGIPPNAADIIYFGKLQTFDSIAWDVNTAAGASSAITWEYWNGSTWTTLTLSSQTSATASNYRADGYGAFTAPSDWATTTVNSELTAYYYIRGRQTASPGSTPTFTQIVSLPVMSGMHMLSAPLNNNIVAVWSENGVSPIRVRTTTASVATNTAPTSSNISPPVINPGTVTTANLNFLRQTVQTSDLTVHAFVQAGTGSSVCAGSDAQGLLWFYSVDRGTTWVCGGQISSDTTNLMYISVTKDSSDNMYVTYSQTGVAGSSTTKDVFFRKLTKGSGASWTLGSSHTVLDGSASSGYQNTTIETDGTRLWLATQYYDNSNYQVSLYYSNGMSPASSGDWTVSQATFDTAGTGNTASTGTLVKFGGNKLAYIYAAQSNDGLFWRFRSTSDGLTTWSTAAEISASGTTGTRISALGMTDGKIHLIYPSTYYYYDGNIWISGLTLDSSMSGNNISMTTDGVNLWVYYTSISGINSGIYSDGGYKLVYKKGVAPFATGNFGSATDVVSYRRIFDKYWSCLSGSCLDDTTDAGDTDSADTRMVTNPDDVVYYGMTEKFDGVSYDLSTSGAGGGVAWEYWNGLAWQSLTMILPIDSPNFTQDGFIEFTPPSDWAKTLVSTDTTAYYFVRARVTTAYTTVPVGSQMFAGVGPSWVNTPTSVMQNTVYALWSENATAPTRFRMSSTTVTQATDQETSAEVAPSVLGYSTLANAQYPTQTTNLRQLVRTSDGALHAFVSGGDSFNNGCNGSIGLVWIKSTNNGATWDCAGQLTASTSANFFPSATVDSSDNIYVVYSPQATSGSTTYDVAYRKLAYSAGSWTMQGEQVVLDSTSSSIGYGHATIVAEGTTRLWLAVRYYDGANYQVSAWYSDGFAAVPTWTSSITTLDTAGTQSAYHHPAIVRFGGNKIGIVYSAQSSSNVRFRYRNDADGLTTWQTEENVIATSANAEFSAVGDSSGNVYVVSNGTGATLIFSYYNGSSWSSEVTLDNPSALSEGASIALDGSNVYVIYNDDTGLSTNNVESSALVYKKGVSPYALSNFTNPIQIVSRYGVVDKYWSYVSSVYTDDTADAQSATSADTQMVTAVGDIAYFGKLEKYDQIAIDQSTTGAAGVVEWEYYNGSSWVTLSSYTAYTSANFLNFLQSNGGILSFTAPSDWGTTQINGESTAYYYIRARVTTTFSTPPVGRQITMAPRMAYPTALESAANGLKVIWTENDVDSQKVRFATVASPGVSAISPSSGPESGGTYFTLTGTNFATGAAVTIGGENSTSIQVTNSTTLTGNTPSSASIGAKDISLSVGGLFGTGSALFTFVPNTPTGCKTSNTSPLAIVISWIDNSTLNTSYTVQKSLNSAAFSDFATGLGANATSTTDTISGANTYAYRVKAVHASGDSTYCTTGTLGASDSSTNQLRINGLQFNGVQIQ